MVIKRFIFVSILMLSVLSIFSQVFNAPRVEAVETINAGFVSGLWYSSNTFFAGDNVRIYSAVQNNSGFDIIGKIQFFDNEEIIGESEFSAINGQLVEKWADWNVKKGDHNIYIKLINTKKAIIGGNLESVDLAFGSSYIDKKFVDSDTDGDKIGDAVDTDDDNDGLSDAEEKRLGTDPLAKDTDGDGAFDGEEVSRGTDPLITSDNNIDGQSRSYEGDTKIGDVKDIAKSVAQKTGSAIDNLAGNLKNKKMAIGENSQSDQNNYYAKLLVVLIYILEHKWPLVVASFFLALIMGKILRII